MEIDDKTKNNLAKGRSSRKKQERVRARRERVVRLYGKKNMKEIAEELGVSPATISNDVSFLKAKGIIEYDKTTEEQETIIKERRRKVTRLWFNGTQDKKEIAERLGVSVSDIIKDIKYLRARGIIESKGKTRTKKNKKRKKEIEARKARREEVAKMYGKKPAKEIARELKVSVTTICSDIKFLRKQGIIADDKANNSRANRKERMEERRKKVALSYEKKTPNEIAEELGVSVSTILNDIRFLKHEKSKKYLPENRYKAMMLEKIKSFYKQGDIENAIKYLDMLQQEIHLTEKEKEKFQEIMELIKLQKERTRRRKIQHYIENEEER